MVSIGRNVPEAQADVRDGVGGFPFWNGTDGARVWGATEASYSFHALVFDGFGGMGLAAGVGRAPCGGGRPRTDGARVYPEDHPQRRGDIRRDRFLQTPTPSTTLLRLIPLFAGGAVGDGNSGW
jgi:hypothetical protein